VGSPGTGTFVFRLSTNRHFLRLGSGRGSQPVEEFGVGLLHVSRRIGVAARHLDSLERLEAESRAQELAGFLHRQQGLARCLGALVADAFSPLGVDFDLRLDAGPVVVEVGVEVVAVEAVDGLRVGPVDVSVADVFADDPAARTPPCRRLQTRI
jgi:hypothetical protein